MTNPHFRAMLLRFAKIALSVLSISFVVAYFTLYIRPDVSLTNSCADALHCQITLKNGGGGFRHGINPVVTWSIPGQYSTLHFSSMAGSLTAGEQTIIYVTLDKGACPQEVHLNEDDGSDLYTITLFQAPSGCPM